MRLLINFLRDPGVAGTDMDAQERLTQHARMLARKRMLREVFTEFHQTFDRLDKRFFTAPGARVELGAGIPPMRQSFADVLATDVVPSPGLDRVLDAQAMDLPAGSVRAIFGQNCFHHFPKPDRFFGELERVLAPGGGCILIEPGDGPLAAFLFKRLFASEGYDKHYPSWETPATGPMNGANQALSHIVFTRDHALFESRHPGLRIVHREPCRNYLKYVLSGGLNFRQLFPDAGVPLVDAMQKLLQPLDRWLALHHVIVLRKD